MKSACAVTIEQYLCVLWNNLNKEIPFFPVRYGDMRKNVALKIRDMWIELGMLFIVWFVERYVTEQLSMRKNYKEKL